MEGAAALRERLESHVLLVTTVRGPGPLEDGSFATPRYGQAARVRVDGKVRLVTSQTLVEGVATVTLSLLDGTPVGTARVGKSFAEEGLAELSCDACRRELRAGLAPAEACGNGRFLFFVAPAGNATVLSHTVVSGPAGPPLERHVVVPGTLPEGMPLFDARAEVAAMVVRPLPGADRSLAVTLCRPAPKGPDESPP
jgi:hypothetical protein